VLPAAVMLSIFMRGLLQLGEQLIDKQKRCFASSLNSDKTIASRRLFALSLPFCSPAGVPGNLFVGSGCHERVKGLLGTSTGMIRADASRCEKVFFATGFPRWAG
jgi:hypothetical protein